MKNARIFLAEDDPLIHGPLKSFLEKAGHEVVSSVYTFADALEAVTRFEELRVEIALVDGNFAPEFKDCREGKKIAEAIAKTGLGVKVVAISSLPGANYGDYLLQKPFTKATLLALVESIPEATSR